MGTAVDLALFSDSNEEINRRFASLVYGCMPPVFKVASSFPDLARRISGYDTIGRLVFLFHGSSGDLILKRVHKSLSHFCGLLKPGKVRVTKQITLDGCNIADYLGVTEMGKMLEFFSAPEIVGFVGFHFWDFLPIPRGFTQKYLTAQLTKYQKFIVAGQPTAAQLVQQGGDSKLLIEWFNAERKKVLPHTPDELRRIRSTRDMIKRHIRVNDAVAFGNEISANPVDSMEVTMTP